VIYFGFTPEKSGDPRSTSCVFAKFTNRIRFSRVANSLDAQRSMSLMRAMRVGADDFSCLVIETC